MYESAYLIYILQPIILQPNMDIFYVYLDGDNHNITIGINASIGDVKSEVSRKHNDNVLTYITYNDCYIDDCELMCNLDINNINISFITRCPDCTSAECSVKNNHIDCLRLSNIKLKSAYTNNKFCGNCVKYKCECDDFYCFCLMPYCECLRDCTCVYCSYYEPEVCEMNNDKTRLIAQCLHYPDKDILLYIINNISGELEYPDLNNIPDALDCDQIEDCISICREHSESFKEMYDQIEYLEHDPGDYWDYPDHIF
jgi:hypothetical protein